MSNETNTTPSDTEPVKMSTAAKKRYDESAIEVLEGLEPVRVRPAMYIGGVDKNGLHHLVWEILDNAVDEFINGHADAITVILHKKNDGVTISDNGRGIPVGLHPKYKKPTLELILTTLHAGGKFGERNGYMYSGGLHGVGSSVVMALSRKLIATIRRDGFEWQQTFGRGKVVSPLEKVGPSRGHGTTIYFEPDPEIFRATAFDAEVIRERLEDMSYVHNGLKITFKNEATGESVEFLHTDGIPALMSKLIAKAEKPVIGEAFAESRKDGDRIEVAVQWTEATEETIRSYVNGIRTAGGGTHETGFRAGIAKAIRGYISTHDVNIKGLEITADDIREGVVGVLSVFVREPMFQGQTKDKLNNPEMMANVDNFVRTKLEGWLSLNPTAADMIVGRIVLAAKARLASREAVAEVKRKSVTQRRLNLPGKLADCKSTAQEETELFIVEGDSAGGCFSGDTRIALADGRTLSFKELIEEQDRGIRNFCYTIRDDGKIGLERILNARVTKRNAEVVRVMLDNGEAIVCTPDHRFMLRDGNYKRADELTVDDSLMPLQRKLSDMREPGITIEGYEMVWDPCSNGWLFTHQLADWYNRWQGVYREEDGDHPHHIDFNKLNNNPTNLQRLSKEEHLALHRAHVSRTLHRPEVVEKCRRLRATEEFRSMMSERMLQPETRKILSEQAILQWQDEDYKAFMVAAWRDFYESNEEYREVNLRQLYEAQREYWSNEEHRRIQAERVRLHFINNPAARDELSQMATVQWQDEELRQWRREKTRQQWTEDFRTKRRAALRKTYHDKTIAALKRFETSPGCVDLSSYDAERIAKRDKSLLRFDRFCERYYGADARRAVEAIANYNHKIVSVERLPDRIDVYDIEVPHTHNFALASGVFVHNSAKQGRNNKTQAVLPLRGKILNSEGLPLVKVLTNAELNDLVTAIGTGAGERFNINGLRYGKIILLMDADADGKHISTLLLAFFFRHMPELIKKGAVFLAQPPLYRIDVGKEIHWARDDRHKEEIIAGLRANARYEVSRFKGLGEMDANELAVTTLDPRYRRLLKVEIDSLLDTDRVFTDLLGKDASQRQKFVLEKAAEVDVEEVDV